ncbi:MAG: hypothetical protein A3C44_00510 [Gammaproteobacteria bacterium RIFCSPHIGHO2_02_FULL_39_13]|nr:MAG: hypothetical protein A3C44_00510 [Gammaproteobacteria bacterium RIFCSPHIGHO2_02_FULL_39_13]OGT48706.1 MAG: hypothetical protein A3E53_05480 [Gammaproteobacteria bacterium RIFCSPHIGHO2_12_FULL_39_24]
MFPISQSELERIMADPSAVYQRPEDVLSDSRLSHKQKVSVLKQWAFDAREIEVAQTENMRGEASPLHQILVILHQLEEQEKQEKQEK